jgi:hypothetical protein
MAGALKISTLNDDTGVLAVRNGMTGIAKAWVNFNGTGTVAIRDSFNVSSITDNGTGSYTVNFTTAIPNANYGVTAMVQGASSAVNSPALVTGSLATSSFSMFTLNNSAGLFDPTVVCVSVFSS